MSTAVDKEQLAILNSIMQNEKFNDYYLAGGTNLAFKYQHRHSIDLDFFIEQDFDMNKTNRLNTLLNTYFKGRFESINITDIGVFGYVDQVKTDFVNYPYPMLKPIELVDDVRLASDIDIAAMKINAVTGRGSKKDFYDIHLLLQKFKLSEMLEAYQEKYGIPNTSMALRSLVYFEDAEAQGVTNNTVVSFVKVSWSKIKQDIIKQVKTY